MFKDIWYNIIGIWCIIVFYLGKVKDWIKKIIGIQEYYLTIKSRFGQSYVIKTRNKYIYLSLKNIVSNPKYRLMVHHISTMSIITTEEDNKIVTLLFLKINNKKMIMLNASSSVRLTYTIDALYAIGKDNIIFENALYVCDIDKDLKTFNLADKVILSCLFIKNYNIDKRDEVCDSLCVKLLNKKEYKDHFIFEYNSSTVNLFPNDSGLYSIIHNKEERHKHEKVFGGEEEIIQ